MTNSALSRDSQRFLKPSRASVHGFHLCSRMVGQSVHTNAVDSKAQLHLRCSASRVAWQLHIRPRFTTNGTLVNSSDALAPYTAARRPQDELHHSYVLYSRDQPPSFVSSKAAWNGTCYDQTANSRFKFSITPILEVVGSPIAARHFVANGGSSRAVIIVEDSRVVQLPPGRDSHPLMLNALTSVHISACQYKKGQVGRKLVSLS